MKVLEIKNNLVKVLYDTDDKLILGGFTVVADEKTPYVGQIVSLKADNGISYAIVRLLFTFDSDGIVKNYDGSIPKLDAEVTLLSSGDLLEILPVQTPIKLGSLAQQDFILNTDISMLQNNLLICSDNAKNTSTIVSNFAKQIENNAESSIIFDTDGKYPDDKKLVFGKDFKLPLNFDSINFIYGHDLNDVDATSRAVIQDIFLEVQDYTRTIPEKFIPFDTFIEVVSQQYTESEIPELALLKNKLLKYKEENVFACSKYEIISLKEYIRDNYTTVVDISNADADLQKEIIQYVYGVLKDMGSYIYSFVKVNDSNCDKKLLKMFLDENKIYTNIICNHNYKYVYELKEKAENLILFAPETTRHDFATYNTFLNKLNHDEFVVWGNATQRIPLIIELVPIEIKQEEPIYMTAVPSIGEEDAEAEAEPDAESDETDKDTALNPVNAASAANIEHDFTEDEDTYTDLSDDIERKPPEEEDYSALSQNENDIEFEEKDDFEEELDKSIAEDLEDPNSLIMTGSEEPENIIDEAPANDFFPVAEPQDDFESDGSDEIVIKENEIIEDSEDIAPSDAFRQVIEPEEITSNIEMPEDEIAYTLPADAEEEVEDDGVEPEYIEEYPQKSDDEIPDNQEEQQEYALPEPEIQLEEDEIVISDDEEQSGSNQEQNIPNILEEDDGRDEEDEEDIHPVFETASEVENPDLMPEDEDLNNDLIQQVAKEIDETFIYNKIEEENIEDNENTDLTEDDLNFIDDINHGENEILEPVVNEPEDFEEQSFERQETEQVPVVPVYAAKTPAATQTFEQGDHVSHPKYGEGIVEKMIKYGEKTLCSINFVNVGRRLLDPAISEISKL